MKSIRFHLSALVRPMRLFLAACVFSVLLFTSVSPAYSSPKTDPTQGETNLTKIEEKSQDAVLQDPYSREKTQAETKKGINEIQGDADADKMKRPSNTPSGKSVEEKVEKALEGVTGNK